MVDSDTLPSAAESWLDDDERCGAAREVLALVVVWSLDQPQQVGEAAIIPPVRTSRLLGRGAPRAGEKPERLELFRQRPGLLEPRPPFDGRGISRRQLLIHARDGRLRVVRVGRCQLAVNGAPCDEGTLRPGDTLTLRNQLVLLCTTRPLRLPADDELPPLESIPFGQADASGIVGESPAVWKLRSQIPFVAQHQGHVLIYGASGTGKELVSRTIHHLSDRGAAELVARNAATFPPALVDAELFGNVRDYPNPGMRERMGLVGAAHGSTLFLDEIGELPSELQAHLLRVLDSDGSYQRLGEDTPRRADLRLVAATNRQPRGLREDFLARLSFRLPVPGLNQRREDVPLLVRHLLLQAAQDDPSLTSRFFQDSDPERGALRVSPRLMDLLVRHRYTYHVRELQGFLWQAMTEQRGRHLGLTEGLREALQPRDETPTAPEELSVQAIRAALDRHGGNQTRAAVDLGLKNRFVLRRLIQKHDL